MFNKSVLALCFSISQVITSMVVFSKSNNCWYHILTKHCLHLTSSIPLTTMSVNTGWCCIRSHHYHYHLNYSYRQPCHSAVSPEIFRRLQEHLWGAQQDNTSMSILTLCRNTERRENPNNFLEKASILW